MLNTQIWREDGTLLPLKDVTKKENGNLYDVCAIIVNRDRPDLTDSLVEQIERMAEVSNISVDVVVVEMGSNKRSKYQSIFYPDESFRGKCYGHNVGLRYALANNHYKYFWFLMNDLKFYNFNALKNLIDIYEKNKRIAILSPTELDSGYPGSRPEKGRDFHVVSTTDYLALLISYENIKQIGFLNPNFKYCWGAIHELSYFANKKQKCVAYCDKVIMKHLGGTTYGKTKNTISREEYQKNAKKFANDYFKNTYGENWEQTFSVHLPEDSETNNFITHKKLWEN